MLRMINLVLALVPLTISPNSSMAKDYRIEAQAVAETIKEARLCGPYIADADSSLIDKLTFKARNVVETAISGLTDHLPYLIRGDQVVIRGSKTYFRLVIGVNELKGQDRWTEGVRFIKESGQAETCSDYELDEAYLATLGAELCHADGVILQRQGQFDTAVDQYLACCRRESAISCNHYAVLKKLIARDDETASDYFRRACDLGYGGACGNLAQMQTKSGNHDRAIALHQEACDKGFRDSCFKATPDGYEIFAK